MTDVPNDMVEGYRDGYSDNRPDLPESLANRSHTYRHGWLNGRDDRMRNPRAPAEELRRRAEMALNLDALPWRSEPIVPE